MLFLGFFVLVIGFALAYSAVKSGNAWKRPWEPLTNALTH